MMLMKPEENEQFEEDYPEQILSTPSMAFAYATCLTQENSFFKAQRSQMCTQMAKLSLVGEGLLKENMQLRSHHTERMKDISKLISTFKVHANESMGSYEHRVHLAKECSVILMKKIEKALAERDEVEVEIATTNEQNDLITDQKCLLEEQSMSKAQAKLQSTLNDATMKALMKQQDKLYSETAQIIREIHQLVIQNAKKHAAVQEIAGFLEREVESQHESKEELEAKKIHIEKEVRELTEENQRLKDDEERLKPVFEAAKARYLVAYNKHQGKLKESQKLYLREDDFVEERKRIKRELFLGHAKKKQGTDKLQSIKATLKQLEQLKSEKQRTFEAIIRGQLLDKIKADHDIKQKAHKQQVRKRKLASDREVDSVKEKAAEVARSIEIAKGTLQLLEIDAEERRKVVESLSNPVAEIERAELILRLTK